MAGVSFIKWACCPDKVSQHFIIKVINEKLVDSYILERVPYIEWSLSWKREEPFGPLEGKNYNTCPSIVLGCSNSKGPEALNFNVHLGLNFDTCSIALHLFSNINALVDSDNVNSLRYTNEKCLLFLITSDLFFHILSLYSQDWDHKLQCWQTKSSYTDFPLYLVTFFFVGMVSVISYKPFWLSLPRVNPSYKEVSL